MFLEFIILIATIFIINVFFYKQTVSEYKILQAENGDLTKATELIPELSPIVVRGFATPNLWTSEDIRPGSRLAALPLIYDGFQPFPLSSAATMVLPTKASSTAALIAQEMGLQVWAEHTILPVFQGLWYGQLLSVQTFAHIGAQGLSQTVAFETILMPTEGDIIVTLLYNNMKAYCPPGTAWKNTFPDSWRKTDTPLITELQYIDIIVRKGNLLIVPPHWRYSYKAQDPASHAQPKVAIIEVHHPMSRIAKWFYKN